MANPVTVVLTAALAFAPATREYRAGVYQFDQPQLEPVTSGLTSVTVHTRTASPRFGAFPVRVSFDNSSGPNQVVSLELADRSDSHVVVKRTVDLRQGERRSVNLTVPAQLYSALVSVRGPTATGQTHVNFMPMANTRLVLCLGRADDFAEFVGHAPATDVEAPTTEVDQVSVMPPQDAPTEPMAYSGYGVVVVPTEKDFATLDAAQRAALEASLWAGGTVVLATPFRATQAFPLLNGASESDPKAQASHPWQTYGLGRLYVTNHLDLGSVADGTPLVDPRARPDRNGTGDGTALLPQAFAPLGTFMFVIIVFTLAIGPGSALIARRRGATTLLFTVPVTAAVTCLLILGLSLFRDGFVTHAASYGYTWLDTAHSRALTIGVNGDYANLAPKEMTFSAATTLYPHWRDYATTGAFDYEFKDGYHFAPNALPSRTYREFALASVAPTRARLGLTERGGRYVAHNALGHDVESLVVNIGGQFYTAAHLADGDEHTLERTEKPTPLGLAPTGVPRGLHLGYRAFVSPTDQIDARFDERLIERFRAPTEPNEFVALIRGQGFMPTGGLRPSLFDGQHLVLGEVTP